MNKSERLGLSVAGFMVVVSSGAYADALWQEKIREISAYKSAAEWCFSSLLKSGENNEEAYMIYARGAAASEELALASEYLLTPDRFAGREQEATILVAKLQTNAAVIEAARHDLCRVAYRSLKKDEGARCGPFLPSNDVAVAGGLAPLVSAVVAEAEKIKKEEKYGDRVVRTIAAHMSGQIWARPEAMSNTVGFFGCIKTN